MIRKIHASFICSSGSSEFLCPNTIGNDSHNNAEAADSDEQPSSSHGILVNDIVDDVGAQQLIFFVA